MPVPVPSSPPQRTGITSPPSGGAAMWTVGEALSFTRLKALLTAVSPTLLVAVRVNDPAVLLVPVIG